MRTNRRAAAGLAITLVAVLAIVAGISFVRASGGSEAARYEVSVQFNTSVTQGDIDETDALLRAYDDDPKFIIMESFPPVGRAVLATDASDFCQTVEAELEAKTYINDVSCRPGTGDGGADPDAPVSTDNDTD